MAPNEALTDIDTPVNRAPEALMTLADFADARVRAHLLANPHWTYGTNGGRVDLNDMLTQARSPEPRTSAVELEAGLIGRLGDLKAATETSTDTRELLAAPMLEPEIQMAGIELQLNRRADDLDLRGLAKLLHKLDRVNHAIDMLRHLLDRRVAIFNRMTPVVLGPNDPVQTEVKARIGKLVQMHQALYERLEPLVIAAAVAV